MNYNFTDHYLHEVSPHKDTIVITGATGFIGKHLVAELLRLGGFRRAFEAIRISPRAIFSLRVLKMLANGLLNQLAHRVLWTFRNCLNLIR